MPKVEREVKKAEAIRWMNILGVNPDVIKMFEKQDIVMACSGVTGTYLPLADPILEAQIREFEQQWDDLVYMGHPHSITLWMAGFAVVHR